MASNEECVNWINGKWINPMDRSVSNINRENNILETGIETSFEGIIITTNDWNDWKFLEKNDNWLGASNYKLTFTKYSI